MLEGSNVSTNSVTCCRVVDNIIVPVNISQDFVDYSSEPSERAYNLKYNAKDLFLGEVPYYLFYEGTTDIGSRYVYVPSSNDIRYYCGETLNDEKCFNSLFTDFPDYISGDIIRNENI